MPRSVRRKRPVFHLIAGPNGAGKTTFATRYLPKYAKTFHFINADALAAGLSPLRPEAAAVAAGKLMLREFDRLSKLRVSFAAETTLAGSTWMGRLRGLRMAGYDLRLYFLWLDSPGLAMQRVAERVRMGGHDVPVGVIRRRYDAGLARFRHLDTGLFDV
jgi:predicted ABC-type ATPase